MINKRGLSLVQGRLRPVYSKFKSFSLKRDERKEEPFNSIAREKKFGPVLCRRQERRMILDLQKYSKNEAQLYLWRGEEQNREEGEMVQNSTR